MARIIIAGVDTAEHLRSVLSDRYAIEREVGAGGMATVYLARDLKHRRRVALKVLKPELGAVLGTERFLSEINVTANLQHPHLLPLFDSGEAEGLLFYVMPYVEGESLRTRLDRERQLPVEEAVRIAVAVASALDYAHRHQVIHRDLKPENILLHDGQPMVADFGIALAISNAGGARVTQTGLSLGTPQYMSPEQATGDRQIDGRTDIYSLGAMLYEMLTGEPPHTGPTVQAIIARVLTEQPRSVRAMRPSVPEHVDAATHCALAKLPADRFSTAGAFADSLTGARPIALTHAAVTRGPRREGWKRRVRAGLPWAIAAVAVLISATSFLRSRRETEPFPTAFPLVLRDSILTRPSGFSNSIALSRDGSQLAFLVGGGIALHAMDGFESRTVRGTQGGVTPAFSPDGRWLLFVDGTKLKRVPITGGTPTVLTDSAGLQFSFSWSDRDEVLFTRQSGSRNSAIWRVPANGGLVTLVAGPDSSRGHLSYTSPLALPDGQAALITIFKGGHVLSQGVLGVVTVPGGKVTELGIPGLNPRYASSGHVVFGRADGSLMAAPFSLRRLRLTGAAVSVLDQVTLRFGGAVEVALSDNGTLAYKSGFGALYHLVKVDRRGTARTLSDQPQNFLWPSVSPDGRRVAVTIANDVWIQDLVAGTLTRLTGNRASTRAAWSPDGQRVAYISSDSGLGRTKWQRWDGSGASEVLLGAYNVADITFGPAHTYLVARVGYSGSRNLWLAPLDSPQALRPLVSTPASESSPRISPNGRLLAYVSDESGRPEVYVLPLPGPGPRIQVSTAGGDEPVWSRDSRELFYRTPTHLLAAIVSESPELAVVSRSTVFPDPYLRNEARAGYDVFPDKSFLMVQKLARGTDMFVVANWTQTLRRRLQGRNDR